MSLAVFEKADRYFYTNPFAESKTFYQQLVERNFGHCPVTLVSTLDVINELSGQMQHDRLCGCIREGLI